MSVFLTVLVISLAFVCGEWKASVRAESDELPFECAVSIYVFGVSIIRLRISFDGFVPALRCVWLKVNGRRLGISLTFDENDKNSIAGYLSNPLAKAVDIKSLFVKLRLGIAGYAGSTVIAIQFIRLALSAALTVLKGMQRVDFRSDIRADFGKNRAKLHVFGIIGLSPVNIIYSFAAAFVKKVRHSARFARRREKGAEK